jgi:hypothetical protein
LTTWPTTEVGSTYAGADGNGLGVVAVLAAVFVASVNGDIADTNAGDVAGVDGDGASKVAIEASATLGFAPVVEDNVPALASWNALTKAATIVVLAFDPLVCASAFCEATVAAADVAPALGGAVAGRFAVKLAVSADAAARSGVASSAADVDVAVVDGFAAGAGVVTTGDVARLARVRIRPSSVVPPVAIACAD